MKQTLEELWNGDVAPWDQCGNDDPQIRELIKLQARNREELRRQLNDTQKAVLEKYIDVTEEYVYRMAGQAFCDGFSLASKLLAEALV